MGQRAVGVDLKLVAVLAGEEPGVSVSALCAELGISRDSYYEARKRFAAEGITGLLARSRRPHRSPGQTPPELEDAIVRARKEIADEGWENGAQTIAYRLSRAGLTPPAVSTIHRVLVRRGLVTPTPQKRPKAADRRFEYPSANGCWQMDGTEWKLANGTKVVIIGAEDDHTRRALAHRVARSENAADVWACFLTAVERNGLPAKVLTDNGVAFNTTRRGWQAEFTRNLAALGISAISSANYHPQTCGKRERLNATLKRWLARQPRAATRAELQAQVDLFDAVYNARPHQSLHGGTPDERLATAPLASPTGAPPPKTKITTVTVSTRGSVPVALHNVGVGRRWAGVRVTVIRQGDDVGIFHGNKLVRRLTIDPTRCYQPTGTPRGGRRQPRVLSRTK